MPHPHPNRMKMRESELLEGYDGEIMFYCVDCRAVKDPPRSVPTFSQTTMNSPMRREESIKEREFRLYEYLRHAAQNDALLIKTDQTRREQHPLAPLPKVSWRKGQWTDV